MRALNHKVIEYRWQASFFVFIKSSPYSGGCLQIIQFLIVSAPLNRAATGTEKNKIVFSSAC